MRALFRLEILSTFTRRFLAFFKKDLLIASSYKFNLIVQVFFVLIIAAIFYFLYISLELDSTDSQKNMTNLLIGLSLIDFMMSAISVFAREVRLAQTLGTFETLLLARASVFTILISSYSFTFMRTLFRVMIYLGISIFFLDINITILSLLMFLMIIILTSLSFIGIGLIRASFIILFKHGDPIALIIAFSSAIFSGAFFSLSNLPQTLQNLTSYNPLKYSLEASNAVLMNFSSFKDITYEVIALINMIFLFLPLGIFLIYYAVRSSKKNGSLNHY